MGGHWGRSVGLHGGPWLIIVLVLKMDDLVRPRNVKSTDNVQSSANKYPGVCGISPMADVLL